MRLHPAAWMAWLVAVATFAIVVSNPLYTLLAICAVAIVHLSFPVSEATLGRAVSLFVVAGAVLLVIRLVFVAILPNPGTTALFTLPRFELPTGIGGFGIGGPVTAEVIVAGAGEGLRLILVLAAFGVFNAHADIAALLRSVPAAFRDFGLIVSIAVTFVPGMLRTVRDVRDAQVLRGERGLRRLAPSLAVPVLGLSLERALLLAESMDARGYGAISALASSRAVLYVGLAGLGASVVMWFTGWSAAAFVSAVIGAVALTWSFRTASSASGTTRLTTPTVTGTDIAVIAASAAAILFALYAGTDASYNPYEIFRAPGFTLRSATTTLFIAAPSLVARR